MKTEKALREVKETCIRATFNNHEQCYVVVQYGGGKNQNPIYLGTIEKVVSA
jgi:hypothetical protein